MALEGHGRFAEYERSRTLIYVSQDVVKDSTFPFQHGDDLWIRIDPDNERLIVEAAPDE